MSEWERRRGGECVCVCEREGDVPNFCSSEGLVATVHVFQIQSKMLERYVSVGVFSSRALV